MRSKLSIFFSDFMDALSDYSCEAISKGRFCEILNELHDIYKYYPSTEIMYKATIQRLTSCGRIAEKRGISKEKECETKWQFKWVNEELNLIKHPPKIIF